MSHKVWHTDLTDATMTGGWPMRLCRSGKRQIYFLRCLDNSSVGFGALAIARDLIAIDPTCPAHRTGALESKKNPCRIAQNYSRRRKITPFPATHTDSTLRFASLSFFFPSPQRHTSIKMESSSKAPVKLVKVTRVLGRTGMRRL